MLIGYFAALYLALGVCECIGEPPAYDEEYVLNFDSPVYVCPDDASKAFLDTSGAEVVRHNETISLMRGSLAFLLKLEPCSLLELIVEKNKNGRTEVILTHEICDFCAELGPESNYHKYFKYFGFPDSCPFGPDTYNINDFVLESEDLPVSKVSEGRYQVTMNFYDNEDCDCKDNRVFRACTKLDFLIEPM